jgi:transcriptional regulator with XRE-family HTH domain
MRKKVSPNPAPLIKGVSVVIKQMRKEQKKSQQHLANQTGLSRWGINKIENQINDIQLSSIVLISEALGITPIELLQRAKKKGR